MQSSIANAKTSNSVSYFDTVVLIDDILSYENNKGKFVIPSLTPTMNNNTISESTLPKQISQNVINRDNLGLSRITVSNYIELEVPRNLFTIKEIKITPNASRDEGHYTSCSPKATIIYNEFKKGQKFIAVYMGSNREDPVIIGVDA